MNTHDNSLNGPPFFESEQSLEWDPGFEGDRWIVMSRFGPFIKVYKKPVNYRKRFHHKVFHLPVRDWKIENSASHFTGFCTLTARLQIRFQPTIRYVLDHVEALPDVVGHIMTSYEGLVKDVMERELSLAEDGAWIDQGLDPIERSIENTVNESLAAQNIQCRTHCELDPEFDESEHSIESMSGHFERQMAYLKLMRRNHDFETQRKQEIFRHTEQNERAALEHQRYLLDQFRRDEAVRQAKDKEESQRIFAQIQEEERRQAARRASEERRQIERIEFEKNLRELELKTKRNEQEMRLQATENSDDVLRREIELLILEKQRTNLEKEVDSMIRQWRRKKAQERADDRPDQNFASLPSLNAVDKN
ncbi:MAG: hypothetical protein ACRER2_01870 [Methylococcales bacterium]